MSLEAMKWALKEAPLSKNGGQCRNRLVLVSLADRYNDDTRVCWPSVGTIARDLGISVPTVRKALGQLEELGLIRRASPHWVQHIPANVRPIVWTLDLSKKKPVEAVNPKDMNGTSDALSGKHGFTSHENDRNTGLPQADNKGLYQADNRGLPQGRNMGLHKTKENPNENPKVNPKTNAHPAGEREPDPIDNEFEEWWRHAPRKVAKKKARGLYERARKSGVPAGVLLSALERDKASWAQEGRALAHIPHPSTWLGQERWADEPDDWSPVSSQAPRPQNFMDALRASRQAETQTGATALPEAARGELPW